MITGTLTHTRARQLLAGARVVIRCSCLPAPRERAVDRTIAPAVG